jgi:hypothetical protein
VGREHGLEGRGDDGREKGLERERRLGTGRIIVRVIVVNSSMARVMLDTSNLQFWSSRSPGLSDCPGEDGRLSDDVENSEDVVVPGV